MQDGGEGFVGRGVGGLRGEGVGEDGGGEDVLEVVEFPLMGGGGIFGEFEGAQEGVASFGDAEAVGLDGAGAAAVGEA